MATQLILYPQSYEGVTTLMSQNSNEYIVDGVNFLTLNASSSYEAGSASLIFVGQYPTIPNTWYRGRNDGFSPLPDYPAAISNDLVFDSNAPFSESLVYQRVTNLTPGQAYNLYVKVNSGTIGSLLIAVYASPGAWPLTQIGSTQSYPVSPGLYTAGFTAPLGGDLIISLKYTNATASTVAVSYVSLLPTSETPTFVSTDGQVICDLYEDEDIPLTLSVDDFKNAAEQVQSYSKAFMLPGTKRNNKIFDNLFEITRSGQNSLIFNPYAKTRCALKQDGFILFEGYLRVIDIQDKEGEISYNVNLYSEVIALADLLGDKTFSEIDFNELTHGYNYTSIRISWQGILNLDNPLPAGSYAGTGSTTNVLRYPFINWNNKYTVGTNDKPVLPNLESSFRPFITLRYLIDRIFAGTNQFTYTSSFIESNADFQRLFMDFNWGGDEFPVPEEEYAASWDTNDKNENPGTGSYKNLMLSTDPTTSLSGSTLPPNYDETTNKITATTTNEMYFISYNYTVRNHGGIADALVEFRWLHTASGVEQPDINHRIDIVNYSGITWEDYIGSFTIILENIGDTIEAQFDVASSVSQYYFPSRVTFVQSTFTVNSATLNTLRGELGQWEFLKGIMTMFNLISMPDPVNPNNILIEPYNTIFLNNKLSKELDWTSKVDISEIKLTPLTDLNKKTIFKFVEDDDDYRFNVYKKSVQGHLYGSKLFDATTTTGGFQSVLDGEEEIVAEPFAATVCSPLMSQFYDFIIPSIYSYNPDDGTSEGFDNSPRIMYFNGLKDAADPNNPFISTTYDVPAQNGGPADAHEDQFLQFSHLTDIPTVVSNPPVSTDTRDFHFGECQLVPPIGDATPNNLFNTYWLPYYNELYNPDTRTMTLKVNLTPGDINTFRFYDTVFIKNRTFRVNKIDYKPNDLATVEFILIP